MTLCIAAEFLHEDKWAIAHCCDRRVEKGGVFHELVGSEDADKMHRFRRTKGLFHALIAGVPTRASDLLASSRQPIAEYDSAEGTLDSDLEMQQLLDSLRKIAAERKRLIISHHLDMAIGISLEEFLKTGKERFTHEHQSQLWSEIRNLDLGADLIFSGFHGPLHEPVLVRLDRGGEVHWESNYAVTGIGLDIALAFLCQQEWRPLHIGIAAAIYRLLEAKVGPDSYTRSFHSTPFGSSSAANSR